MRFDTCAKLFFACMVGVLLFSCSKEKEIVTQTVIEIQNDTATTFILVRHAETTGIGSNPNLSAAGLARADELRRMLELVELNAVYSTAYNRTEQTAEPTALDQGLVVLEYDPAELEAFVDSTLLDFDKGVVLVVGHSNTTPDLLNILTGGNDYVDLPETEYDNLYITTVRAKGDATVLHLKYGE